jgi:Protein of unknown function (DUF3551)
MHAWRAEPTHPISIARLKGLHTHNKNRESQMSQFWRMSAAPATALVALGFVAFTASATPASAGEYCRKDVSSAMTSCSFDTMEQCHAMSSGRGGGCFRDPFLPERNTLAYAPNPLHDKQVTHRARTHAE